MATSHNQRWVRETTKRLVENADYIKYNGYCKCRSKKQAYRNVLRDCKRLVPEYLEPWELAA